jgi:sec-independent protein translocase protein TatC
MAQQNFSKIMSFYDHFDEIRVRLFRCLFVFFIGFVGFYFISEPILEILRRPLMEVLPEGQQKLYYTHLFENFLTHLKIGAYASFFFLSPYYFYELWAFIAPGLYPRERKWVVPFVAFATLFFVGGAGFAYFVLFPIGFKYFINYGSEVDFPLITMDGYYSTCLKLLLLFGISFELPVILCLLGYLGLVTSEFLRQQRQVAILMITLASALFAPPDALSMILLGVPLVGLYEVAILIIQWFERRRIHAILG